MLTALRIPEWDRDITLSEHEPRNYATPPNKSDRFTRIEIVMFEGRSLDAKRDLYRAIVDNLSVLGVDPEDVKIVVIDAPLSNWGLRGGQAACDLDLGFEIEV
jgi:phenylpyruvate tautomerase PptA (4-oxalocrotonate tautomerase family)